MITALTIILINKANTDAKFWPNILLSLFSIIIAIFQDFALLHLLQRI
jgi:hypothetical protein